jgi:hypothetical protein
MIGKEKTMDRSTLRMEEHPDLTALRTRYENVAATSVSQSIDGLTALTGLYLAMAPWVTGFPASAHGLAVVDLVTGLAITLLGVGFATAYGRTHGLAWTAPVLGAWALVAPWLVLDHAVTAVTAASNVVCGAAVLILALITLTLPAGRARTPVVTRA